MRTGRPKAPLVLTEAERESLESLATRARTRPHLARRARIILLCGEGLASTVVARRLHTRAQTIGKWRAALSATGSTVCTMNPARGRRGRLPTRTSNAW